MKKYTIIVPVWGKSYINTYINVSLPSQLAPRNLPTLVNRQGVVYRIYTRPQDVAILKAATVVVRLTKYVKTEIIGAQNVNFKASHHYKPFSDCYRLGIKRAQQEHAAAIFLTADQVWADGSIAQIIRLGDGGFRCVLVSGPRVNQDTFIATLNMASAELVKIPPRQAVKLSMDHLHPWDRSLFWDEDNYGRPASFMYWSVANEGFIMRCFHLHPVLLNPANGFPQLRRTIDGSDFVKQACPDLKDLYVVQDSDEVMYFSVAPPEQSSEWIERPATDLSSVISWAWTMGISRHNLHYLKKTVRFHSEECSEKWSEVQKRSDNVVQSLVKALNHPLKLRFVRLYVEFRIMMVTILQHYPKLHFWSKQKKNRFLTIISEKVMALKGLK